MPAFVGYCNRLYHLNDHNTAYNNNYNNKIVLYRGCCKSQAHQYNATNRAHDEEAISSQPHSSKMQLTIQLKWI